MRAAPKSSTSGRVRGFTGLAGLALAVLLALPAAASAFPEPTLYATTGGPGNNNSPAPPSDLYRVDPATGATTSVGKTGHSITGLAQDPTTGILYGVSNPISPLAPLTLLRLDPATGAVTQVGPLGPERRIADITFDSSGRLFGWESSADDLAAIDKQTGAVTAIPNPLEEVSGGGSAIDRDDTFWLFGEEGTPYHTLDTATGAATLHGTLKPIDANERPVSAAAWDCPRSTLYATLNPTDTGQPANLVTIDVATGTLTNKGTTVTDADGLEWYCPLAFEFGKTTLKVGPGKKRAVTVPLARGPRIKGAATVAYATANGSAKAGVDFKRRSGTAIFLNNVTEHPLTLSLTPDPKAGKNRTFTLALSNPSAGGTVGQPLKVTITTSKPRVRVRGPGETEAKRPTFKLRSNQLPAKFRCKLDGGRFKGCGKNGKKGKRFKTPALDPGSHRLVVQAVNAAGRKSKPVTKKFVVLG